jgi:hypothetical protein
MFAVDVRPLQRLTPQVVASNLTVLGTMEPAMLAQGGRRGGGGFGGSASIPADIYYWLRSGGPVSVNVMDASGSSVRQLTGTGNAGLNMVSWNLAGTGGAGGAGGRGGQAQGQRGGGGGNAVAPGIYTIEIRQGSSTATGMVAVSR